MMIKRRANIGRPSLFAICVYFYGASRTSPPTNVVLNRSREILRFLIEQKNAWLFSFFVGDDLPGVPPLCAMIARFRDAEDVIPYKKF